MKPIAVLAMVPTAAVASITGLHNSQQCNQAALLHRGPRGDHFPFVKQPRQEDGDPSSTVTVVIIPDVPATAPSDDANPTPDPGASTSTLVDSDSLTFITDSTIPTDSTTALSVAGGTKRRAARAIQATTVTVTDQQQFSSLLGTHASTVRNGMPTGPVTVSFPQATVTLPGIYTVDPTFISYTTSTTSVSYAIVTPGPTTTVGAIIDPRPGGFTIIDGLPFSEWISQHPAQVSFAPGGTQGTTTLATTPGQTRTVLIIADQASSLGTDSGASLTGRSPEPTATVLIYSTITTTETVTTSVATASPTSSSLSSRLSSATTKMALAGPAAAVSIVLACLLLV